MKCTRVIACVVFLILAMNAFSPFCFAEKMDSTQNPMGISDHNSSDEQPAGDKDARAVAERNNVDTAALLSLFGIGLLKFVDDKLKIKFKNAHGTYEKWLKGFTVVCVLFEVLIIVCYLGRLGSTSFGNLKNISLGLIPVVFCVLTLSAEKTDGDPTTLSHTELEKRINDFTSSGMSPLGMIVGDMDFFGKVYKKGDTSKRRSRVKDDITKSSQIQALIENKIDDIKIVCKIPATSDAKRRIGYLLSEFDGQFHIRFFNEKKFPIPKMRGRIMYKQNEQVVVITKKIRKPSKYEYSEYAVSSLPGGLFADLWETVWNCAEEKPDITSHCMEEYAAYAGKQPEDVS